MTQESQKMLKPREFATEYRIGANKVYELLKSGALPHLKLGRNILIPRKAAEAWLEAQTIRAS